MNYEITIELRDGDGKKNGANLTLRRAHGGDGFVAVSLVAALETLSKGGA